MSEFVTSSGTGVLIFGQRHVQTEYQLHTTVGGRAVMVELFERPADVPPDTDVQLLLANGRVIGCRILDDTPMCAVIGEGVPTAEHWKPPMKRGAQYEDA